MRLKNGADEHPDNQKSGRISINECDRSSCDLSVVMKRIKVRIKPLTGFSSPLLGETLFGQICWQIRLELGEDLLRSLLDGYSEGSPYLVVSDAFPSGCLPMPLLPTNYWNLGISNLKELKNRVWIRTADLNHPICDWKSYALTENEGIKTSVQTHNTINRYTDTTGLDQFAPFNTSVSFYPLNAELDIYLLVRDEIENIVKQVFQSVGISGFGKDASVGLGKFQVLAYETVEWKEKPGSFLTLSSSDITGLELDRPIFYKTKVHFGRHGLLNAVSGNPFKKPLVLATKGAVLTPKKSGFYEWLGRGIPNVSASRPETVHQGYSIVYPLGSLEI